MGGCSGYGPHGCHGFGCDNGVELDVVPGQHTTSTQLWASHGSEYHYIFWTETGPDGLGPPNNITFCNFDQDETQLSATMMAHWASFARHGDPNTGAVSGAVRWPAVTLDARGKVITQRLRFSVAATDGIPTGLVGGIHDENCDFWDALYQPGATLDPLRSSGDLGARPLHPPKVWWV